MQIGYLMQVIMNVVLAPNTFVTMLILILSNMVFWDLVCFAQIIIMVELDKYFCPSCLGLSKTA